MRRAGGWPAPSSGCGSAATALVGVLPDRPDRSQAAAKELLGEDFGGFVVSDRYAGYHFLDVLQQQFAGLTRFASWSSSPSARALPASSAQTRDGRTRSDRTSTTATSRSEHTLRLAARESSPRCESASRTLLSRATRGRHEKTANFCAGLLEEYEALWTFCEVPDIPLDQ